MRLAGIFKSLYKAKLAEMENTRTASLEQSDVTSSRENAALSQSALDLLKEGRPPRQQDVKSIAIPGLPPQFESSVQISLAGTAAQQQSLELVAARRKKAEEPAPKRTEDEEEEEEEDEKEEDHDHDHDGDEDDDKDTDPTHDPKNGKPDANPLPSSKLFFGSLHGHSVYSDGMCKPKELYQSAKDQKLDFVAVTDHSHKSARRGVKPDNPRFEEEKKHPLLVDAPEAYAETIHVAKQATQDGKFVGIVGVELGTIGKPGAKEMAGVNHINILEVDALIQSIKGREKKTDVDLPKELQAFEKPEVIKVRDGDYKALVDRLDKIKDMTGGRPVIQLNHPRFREDEHEKHPPERRGRDYGQKSFSSQEEWVQRFGKYASQLEILSGEALKQKPSGEFKSHAIHATDFAGYLDKGLHLSPTFGRDSHYCDADGVNAATGVLAEKLDKKSIMDALRERRTIATMNSDALAGYMVMNGRHVMGSIVDEKDAPDVHVSVTINSAIQPDAKYTAILWADTKVGDGQLAEKVQTVNITGKDLMSRGSQVKFHGVDHTAGNKSVFYVEVQRKNEGSSKAVRMWTAPVWVEPNVGESNADKMDRLKGITPNRITPPEHPVKPPDADDKPKEAPKSKSWIDKFWELLGY
jgi:hypothetical protein